jgi:hypothetical protein
MLMMVSCPEPAPATRRSVFAHWLAQMRNDDAYRSKASRGFVGPGGWMERGPGFSQGCINFSFRGERINTSVAERNEHQ